MSAQAVSFSGQDISASFGAVVSAAAERRLYLHANPQVAYKETVASGLVQKALSELGLEFRVIETVNPQDGSIARTGLVVDIEGLPCPDGRKMGFRGDMDALPNTYEKTGLPHASQNEGVMHGCGHDGHTVMLLAAAEMLVANRDKFRGTVRLLFQPAEEGAKGAKAMIKGGALEGLDPDKHPLIGYHNAPFLPLGKIATNPGAIMAAADYIESLTITGKGGHVGLDFLSPVTAMNKVLTRFEGIKAEANKNGREVSLEITQVDVAKSSISTVPDRVTMAGSFRSFDPDLRIKIKAEIEAVCEELKMLGYGVELKYRQGTDPTINNAVVAGFVTKVAREAFGEDMVDGNVPRAFTAEDMGAYGLRHTDIPHFKPFRIGFVWTGQGTGNPESPHDQTLHAATYDFNNELIGKVLALTLKLIERGLPVEGPSAYPGFEP
jgi:hippurate hydrolase